MKEGENVLSDSNKGFYLAKLEKLNVICPKEKAEELKKLCEIVESK